MSDIELAFQCPTRISVAGPSNCGKTVFVQQLLNSNLLYPPPDRIIYVYTEYQPLYNEIKARHDNVEFICGWDASIYDGLIDGRHTVLVLDDVQSSVQNDASIGNLFTKGSHHRNITVVVILQNLFPPGSVMVNVRRNIEYHILFASRADAYQINLFARRAFPNKFRPFIDAYKLATSEDHGYLMVDMRNKCKPEWSLRGRIFDPYPRFYVQMPN